jgi:hypothetical protein
MNVHSSAVSSTITIRSKDIKDINSKDLDNILIHSMGAVSKCFVNQRGGHALAHLAGHDYKHSFIVATAFYDGLLHENKFREMLIATELSDGAVDTREYEAACLSAANLPTHHWRHYVVVNGLNVDRSRLYGLRDKDLISELLLMAHEFKIQKAHS